MNKESAPLGDRCEERPATQEIESCGERLRRLAMAQARRVGMGPQDAEDCGGEFLLRAIQRGWAGAGGRSGEAPEPAQLHRITLNFALNFRRGAERRKVHGVEPHCASREDETHAVGEIVDRAPSPEARVLQREFWERLQPALTRLRPVPRALLLRHYLNGESCAELAIAYRKTSHAVEDTLHRARRRLREICAGMDLTEAELHEYLAPFTPAAGSLRGGGQHDDG